MNILRFVVTGTPGAGKTSFVRSISDVGVIDTDRTATDATAQIKPSTTVAFDYGRVTVGSAFQLHVYGTPGQSRFNFMWDILMQRAHAYILLVAAHRPEDFSKTREIVDFMNQQVKIPMIVGITHLDCPEAYTCEEVMLRLGYGDRDRPMAIGVDANNSASVNLAMHLALLAVLLDQRHRPIAMPLRPFARSSASHREPLPVTLDRSLNALK